MRCRSRSANALADGAGRQVRDGRKGHRRRQAADLQERAADAPRHALLNSINWGEREYLVYQDERVTFAAHYKAVAHLAQGCASDFGVKKGDRVAVIMRNYPQWSVGFLGGAGDRRHRHADELLVDRARSWNTAFRIRARRSPSSIPKSWSASANTCRSSPALKHVYRRARMDEEADPRIVSLDKLIGAPNSWKTCLTFRCRTPRSARKTTPPSCTPRAPPENPKARWRTHRGIVSNVFNGMACQARHFLRQGQPVPVRDPKVDPPRIPLLAIPFFHATGAFANLVPAMINADKIVTMYKWDPVEALGIIEREKITMYRRRAGDRLAGARASRPRQVRSLLDPVVAYGGAPSAPELVATIKRAFPTGHASNGWGMTETCATACVNFGKDYEVRPDSCGAAAPAMDFKIVGAKGETLRRQRSRRAVGQGPQQLQGLLEQAGSHRQDLSSTAGSSPATSAAWTRKASSSCSTAPRTC